MMDHGKKYLYDILNAIELIESFLQDVPDFDDYASDSKTQSAIERQLAIIGEAANKFQKREKQSLKNIHKIIGLRNRIIHAYDHIDNTIIWAIIKRYIPDLKKEVKKLIAK